MTWVKYASKTMVERQSQVFLGALMIQQPGARVRYFLTYSNAGKFRVSQLAERLRVSPSTIRRIAKEHGLYQLERGWMTTITEKEMNS